MSFLLQLFMRFHKGTLKNKSQNRFYNIFKSVHYILAKIQQVKEIHLTADNTKELFCL